MNDLEFMVNCAICSNEMCEPTTMSCGHSFCRLCTVKWCFHYRHYNCPVCRRPLSEKTLPNVNLTLKYLIAVVKERQVVKLADVDPLSNTNLQQQAIFDHDYLISKISKQLHSSASKDDDVAAFYQENTNSNACLSDDSTLSRLNIVYFPFYLGLTAAGYLFLAFLNLIKRMLK